MDNSKWNSNLLMDFKPVKYLQYFIVLKRALFHPNNSSSFQGILTCFSTTHSITSFSSDYSWKNLTSLNWQLIALYKLALIVPLTSTRESSKMRNCYAGEVWSACCWAVTLLKSCSMIVITQFSGGRDESLSLSTYPMWTTLLGSHWNVLTNGDLWAHCTPT
jgi:hypothetical protein